jgi:hypothetical protein
VGDLDKKSLTGTTDAEMGVAEWELRKEGRLEGEAMARWCNEVGGVGAH